MFPAFSANHRLPSGPKVIASGEARGVGIPYSAVKTPSVSIRPILLACCVNHKAPSGPATIPRGPLLPSGRGNTSMLPQAVLVASSHVAMANRSSGRRATGCPKCLRQKPFIRGLVRSPIPCLRIMGEPQRSTWEVDFCRLDLVPLPERCARARYDKHRARGVANDFFRHAAHDEVAYPAASVG